MNLDANLDTDFDAEYDCDDDFDADSDMSDDGTTAESDYELNSADSDQIFETEQNCTPIHDSDAQRDVEGEVMMDAWDAKGTWYRQSYYPDDDTGDDPDESETPSEDEQLEDEQLEDEQLEDELPDDKDEDEAEHDYVWSRAFTEPHLEYRYRRKNREPESIGNILRKIFGLKKKKKEQRPEGHVPDEELDWAQEKYEEYLEEGDEQPEPDDDERFQEYEN